GQPEYLGESQPAESQGRPGFGLTSSEPWSVGRLTWSLKTKLIAAPKEPPDKCFSALSSGVCVCVLLCWSRLDGLLPLASLVPSVGA
ncbi:hypothetical protein JOQ06_012357, partial [Pogonophryne albipinna]